MIKGNAGAKSPKLDQVRIWAVTGLQELQDRAEEAGSLKAYINWLLPQTESLVTASLCLEWDASSSELRIVNSTYKRAENCLQFGHLPPWRSSDSLWVGLRPLEALKCWEAFLLGEISADVLIEMLRHNMLPLDIEYDALGFELRDLLLGLHKVGYNRHEKVIRLGQGSHQGLVEAILSCYLAEGKPEPQLEDCDELWDIEAWLCWWANPSPKLRRLLELLDALHI